MVERRAVSQDFPSYSHRDSAIVEQFERFAEASGDEYLRDVRALRSGEEWDPRLRDFIDEAHVFQLFWSREAMASPNVADEWRYALSLNRPGFIRPTYWEQPMPTSPGLPPKELGRFHFHPFDKAILSPQRLDAAAAISAPDELSPKQQLAIVLELRQALRRQTDDKGRHDIRRLLGALRRRPEATYAAVVEIDDIIAADTGGPRPAEAPTTTYRNRPTHPPRSSECLRRRHSSRCSHRPGSRPSRPGRRSSRPGRHRHRWARRRCLSHRRRGAAHECGWRSSGWRSSWSASRSSLSWSCHDRHIAAERSQ